ncbi:MAG: hypothetical protein ABIW58_07190 [Sphingomicrobium sp.]
MPDTADAGCVDYDIHGLLGIRLIHPSPGDIGKVSGQIGLLPTSLSREPGIVIHFVDALPIEAPLCHLGREDVGYTDGQFVLLRSHNLARARTQLAFETFDKRIEITCESGLPAIPLLRPLINLAMLARGIVPVHAAAFEHSGKGVLVTGWSHGSKTGTLLSFMADGAKFVGDEWIYLDADRDRMVGLPDHLEARPWYLRDLPLYRRHAGRKERLRVAVAERAARWLAPKVPGSERRNSLTSKIIRFAHHALMDQQSIDLTPTALFGREACKLESGLDVIIVAISRDSPDISVKTAPVERVATQMAASFMFEQASLLSCYQKYLFAFPGRRNALLDQAEEIYHGHALRALAGKRAYTMLHPYPVSIHALRNAVRPLLEIFGNPAVPRE